MAELAFDRMDLCVLDFDDFIAAQTKPFPILKFLGRFVSGFAVAAYPVGELLTVDPDMVPFIPTVGCAMIKPITQGGFGNVQVFGYFTRCIKHGQQARCFDNDIPGNTTF